MDGNCLPTDQAAEEIVWSNVLTKDIFNKKVLEIQKITN
jgi:hypothetical protein